MTSIGIWLILTALAVAAVICFVPAYAKAKQHKVSTATTLLRNAETAGEMSKVGSYNAFFQEGEKFRGYAHDAPATIDYNNDEIRVRVLPKGAKVAKEYHYKKDNSEILWIGNSGRYKDITEWISLSNEHGTSLISAFTGTQYITTDWHTKNLYLKLDELGYNTGIDTKKRSLVRQTVFSMALLILGVFQIFNGLLLPGVGLAIFSFILFGLEFKPKKVPMRT